MEEVDGSCGDAEEIRVEEVESAAQETKVGKSLGTLGIKVEPVGNLDHKGRKRLTNLSKFVPEILKAVAKATWSQCMREKDSIACKKYMKLRQLKHSLK